MNSEKRILISVNDTGPKHSKSIINYVKDHVDTIVLLASVVFNVASIALAILVFVGHARRRNYIPQVILELQRLISAGSLTISSAVMALVGKRYIYSKLSNGDGIHTKRIVLYSDTSITSILGGIFQIEMLSFVLLASWGLGFATGLTVNYTAKLVPVKTIGQIGLPVGTLDLTQPFTSLFDATSSFFNPMPTAYVFDTYFSSLGNYIEVFGMLTTTGTPMGRIIYPSIATPPYLAHTKPSYTTAAVLNGFQIAVQNASSNLDEDPYCSVGGVYDVWFAGADLQSLTLITNFTGSDYGKGDVSSSPTQYTATAVIMGGALSGPVQGDSSIVGGSFIVDGRTWPLTMSGTQWATLIVDVICNTSDVFDWTAAFNGHHFYDIPTWTSMLGSVVGSYSAANAGFFLPPVYIQYQEPALLALVPDYGVSVLIPNIVISIIMLIIAWQFGRGSQLHPDFLNSIRILLDFLKKDNISLSNQSLGTTEEALGNPCLQVIHNKHSNLAGQLDIGSSLHEAPFSPLLPSSLLPHSTHHLVPHSRSNSHSALHS